MFVLGICDLSGAGTRACLSLGDSNTLSGLSLNDWSIEGPPVFVGNDGTTHAPNFVSRSFPSSRCVPLRTAPAGVAFAAHGQFASRRGAATILSVNAAVPKDQAVEVALGIVDRLEEQGAFASAGPFLLGGAIRMPEGTGPCCHRIAGGSLPQGSLPDAPAGLSIQDPLLAALVHVLEARGLPSALILVPGFRPSWKDADRVSLDCAERLGEVLEGVTGLRFDCGRCRGLEIRTRWFEDESRSDNLLYL